MFLAKKLKKDDQADEQKRWSRKEVGENVCVGNILVYSFSGRIKEKVQFKGVVKS